MKKEIDEKLPGDWTSVDASELFALFILSLVLVLVAINGLSLGQSIIKEIVVVCLFVLFGGKYMKIKGK
jgi:fatty acid desaturase